ncbi:hypothetical protein LUI11_02655 [Bradyrhizobium diazoefficiens]|uniref:hypothetical protein n=1 Tax=Bradyrhizobium TaxID=374 RepID=UPI000A428C16|nr:hypothetical protein [Bradyrhizobium diazoefficiens]MCD9292990.1 hypothetical protein [Bradyrhizobium diazoefficiens]MCD9808050.1 hypothetical protein [Bradyrhizobium diazoefficiens]MCD9826396.1 hypothetical protein [Bradyrhizobium diazoefficiens]MCD9845645.1 hypothetical protein [Bradyrhizobium diazoefficiens]MCD9881653.1 hypothetical protein [Bradyrhizobium diazoefficiens]
MPSSGDTGASLCLAEMLTISSEVSRYISAKTDSVVSTLSQRSCRTAPAAALLRLDDAVG